jgi:hypothetical protein
MSTKTQSLGDRVRPQLTAARAAHSELSARVAEVTLAAAVDATPEAVAERDDLNRQLAGAQINLDQFERAYALAQQRDRLAECERERAAHEETIREFEAACDKRLKSARQISAAFLKATRAYGELLDATRKMRMTFPTGLVEHYLPWNDLTFLDAAGIGFGAEISICVAAEAYRHSAGGQLALPGAKVAHLSLQLQPEKIEPLDVIVQRSNAYFVQELRAGFDRVERASMARAEKANGAAS